MLIEPAEIETCQKPQQRDITVAAIVPVYNVESYLEECMTSLLNQSLPFDKIILVDDGSTDESGEICDRYAFEYSDIVCVHKENEGLGFARNTGLDYLGCEADYVMFVDSDDWLESDALERLLAAAIERDADCVIGGHTKKDSGHNTRFVVELENGVNEGTSIREELIPRLCGSLPGASDSIPMSACGSLFKLSIIQKYDLRFPSERKMISEDFVFKYYFLLHARRVAISDSVQYCYRTNDSSLTRSYRADRFDAVLHFYQEVLAMLCKENLANKCTTRLQKTLLIYLRMCVKQERRAVSGKSFFEGRRAIASILADGTVRRVISQYPFEKLHWRQRFFFNLVRMRLSALLLLLAELGIL